MWQQTSFKCFLKLGKLSRCVSNTTCRHQWDSGVSYSSISQCGTVRRLVRSDVISYWRLFHVICSSPQWIPLTEHGQRRKLFFFRIVMKLPSTDVTFLLCSKLSVYFLTYLLSRPAAMHCSTHVTRGDNVLYAFVRRRQFEQRCSPATRLFSEGAWIGCKRVAFICSNCTIVG